MGPPLLLACLLAPLCARGASMGSPPGWRHHEGARRVKRAWVIPPISISENHKRIPHLLVQIKSDKQQPGGVIYSIKGPGVDEEPLGIFSIDKFSGKVFLNATLDREQNDRFRLKAFALDLGGATLEDPTDLEIIVVDQNDNRPLFSSDVFTGHIVEGAAPGTCVLTVEATDADDPETDNAALRFSILEQGHGDMFRINASTGEICTARGGLDREAVGVYNLTLQAADMSGDGLTTTATAVIHLDDINDNAPEFTKEEVLRMAGVRGGGAAPPADTSPLQFSTEVEEQAGGAEVGRVLVHDKDLAGSPNWAAKFTILEGDPEGAFAIHTDPHTNDGVLTVAKVGGGRADPPLSATGTLSIEIVEVNDHAPQLLPPSGAVCGRPGRGGAVLLGASDRDRPPHGAPFHFQLSPRHPQLARNWSITRFNVTHAVLAVLAELPAGPYSLPLVLRDSGTPPREQQQLLNVSVCPCGRDGLCEDGVLAATSAGVGVALEALVVIVSSGILLLLLALLGAAQVRSRRREHRRALLQRWGDDVRDSVLNYDEQGGGEEDQDAYDLSQLRHPPPHCRPPLRRDAPLRSSPAPGPLRRPPRGPSDIEDFINEGLEAADGDPSVPPYDTALIYDYEGSGSAGSALSSIVSSLTDGDQDYDYLREWGPRFRRLADLYGP
ncbi:hypothetical protein ASZ78_008349 [Callipepla squamata]|uniref:Cadherin-15 n=1 Tax=Callipepla squamata TaxID=9009 RepID=A0A226NBR7_CALSU|nr:hypothetical protein ASZ78_008349 [Callipepla squamata]